MNSLPVLAALLLVLSTSVQAANRMCAQCVAGQFLSKQHLFQNSAIGQAMGWVEEWSITNCKKPNEVRYIECQHSCLTVIVEKHAGSINDGYSAMLDCSDNLIHATPDLPAGIDFTAYSKFDTFTAVRSNHTITYRFVADNRNINQQLGDADRFILKDSDAYPFSTIVLTVAGACAVIIVAVYVALNVMVNWKNRRLGRRQVSRAPQRGIHLLDMTELQDYHRRREAARAQIQTTTTPTAPV